MRVSRRRCEPAGRSLIFRDSGEARQSAPTAATGRGGGFASPPRVSTASRQPSGDRVPRPRWPTETSSWNRGSIRRGSRPPGCRRRAGGDLRRSRPDVIAWYTAAPLCTRSTGAFHPGRFLPPARLLHARGRVQPPSVLHLHPLACGDSRPGLARRARQFTADVPRPTATAPATQADSISAGNATQLTPASNCRRVAWPCIEL